MIKKIITHITALLIAGLCLLGIWWLYRTYFTTQAPALFTTQRIERRPISQIIYATGKLQAENTLKIGSLVPGIIKKMYFEESTFVKKGDLLAEIDDGKSDSEVRESLGILDHAKADAIYQRAYYQRQQSLFEAGHISRDSFEKVTRDLHIAEADLISKQGMYDRVKLNFDNKKIHAPTDGLIITKNSSEGETVTVFSPPTIIYTITENIEKMVASIVIDENNIGKVTIGTEVLLIYDAYPYKKFTGTIHSISSGPIEKERSISYEATINQDNKEKLLREGMTVNAQIIVAEKDDVLALPSHLLTINSTALQQVAQALGYRFSPLDRKEKERLQKEEAIRTVWVFIEEEKHFKEKPVSFGSNDDAYFEITKGLTGNELIVSGVAQADVMQQFYKRTFRSGFN